MGELFETLKLLMPDGSTWLLWLLAAVMAYGLVMALAKAAAALVAPIPFVGPFLSFVILMVAGQWQRYLTEELPKLLDQGVQATEAMATNTVKAQAAALGKPFDLAEAAGHSLAKRDKAIAVAKQIDPVAKAVPKGTMTAEVEAAVTRMKGGEQTAAQTFEQLLEGMKGAQ